MSTRSTIGLDIHSVDDLVDIQHVDDTGRHLVDDRLENGGGVIDESGQPATARCGTLVRQARRDGGVTHGRRVCGAWPGAPAHPRRS